MNTLSRDTLLAFGRIGRELGQSSDTRAVVITSAGTKAFCAGADLKERKGMDENDVRKQLELYRSELLWILDYPAPVVAAINGVALGGGLELALLCDLRVAAEHALLGLPEVSIGIIPGAGGTQRLPRIVGEARAKELILFGRRLKAKEALEIGLVNQVTPEGQDVLQDTLSYIAPLAGGAPLAQAAALRAIDAAYEVPFSHGIELERMFYDTCLRSEDRVEALSAFAEKRKPVFKGR
ncbi:MAG: enoyl-CoA hydratase/isomerase family protein [Polyangiaceae bacterium]|nr:enoyl-CoA hydratase/isomerase family protein [Myxococcales bacterium]MCB9590005.1 enoyl-CoA hydratase/isomerase family protein [Polyangiaceae bacterium]